MVYFKKIPVQIRNDVYEAGFDEFRQDCYIVLTNAVKGVDINKIKNPCTYSLYVQYSQWLHNFITRDIVRDYCHNYSIRYMDYFTEDEHGDIITWEPAVTNDKHSNIWDLVKTLPDKWQDKCIKAAWHMPRGGRASNKWPKEITDLFKDFYTEY